MRVEFIAANVCCYSYKENESDGGENDGEEKLELKEEGNNEQDDREKIERVSEKGDRGGEGRVRER